MNLGDANLSDSEISKFNACLGKYAMSFELYTEEKKLYKNRLDDMEIQ